MEWPTCQARSLYIVISQQGIACRSTITVIQVSVLTTFCVHSRIDDNFVIKVADFGLSEDYICKELFQTVETGRGGRGGRGVCETARQMDGCGKSQ